MTPIELYQFFSNRNLLQWPKSTETLISDINEEFGIDSNAMLNGYAIMKKQLNKITNESCVKELDLIYSSKFKDNIKEVLEEARKDLEYKRLCAQKSHLLKNLYRITIPNFIFSFVSSHKKILPENTIEKILPLITNVVYVKNHSALNTYIKKSLIMKILIDIDNRNFMEYYKYCRFRYLYDRLIELKLTPKCYNSDSGALYFTISYSQGSQKEQIFEKLRSINNNCAIINIDEVQLYINSNIGEIARIRKLFDKRWKKFHTDISDNISYVVPNIIRKIIHNLIDKFSRKSYKYSYNQMLGYLLKHDFIVEDYCEKVGNEGTILRVPINKEWVTMSSKEVRKLTINDIDIKLLLDSYESILKPMLQAIINSK